VALFLIGIVLSFYQSLLEMTGQAVKRGWAGGGV
jgi:hypothetical protein